MTIPKLTPYTGQVANPDGSQTQTEFTQNMFDQLSYEAQLATQLDATIDGMNSTVDEVEANAVSAQNSVNAAEAAASSAGYKGLWPDTGGLAEKGDTWQTQVGGTPTGEYYTALQDTSVDPVGDNVNWKFQNDLNTGNLSDYTDLVFDDLDSAVNSATIKSGDLIRLIERTMGNGGGGFWGVVPTSSVTPNGYSIVENSYDPSISLVIVKSPAMSVSMFGDDSNPLVRSFAESYIDDNGVNFIAGNNELKRGRATNTLIQSLEDLQPCRVHQEPRSDIDSGTVVKYDWMFDPFESNNVDYRILNVYTQTGDLHGTGEGAVCAINAKGVGNFWGLWPSINFGFQDLGENAVCAKMWYGDHNQPEHFTPNKGNWRDGKVVNSGDYVTNNNFIFKAVNSGSCGSTAPTHSSGTVSDGSIDWEFIFSPNYNTVRATYMFGDRSDMPVLGYPGVRAQFLKDYLTAWGAAGSYTDSDGLLIAKIRAAATSGGVTKWLHLETAGGGYKRFHQNENYEQNINLATASQVVTSVDLSTSVSAEGMTTIRFDNSAATTVTNLTGGISGQRLRLVSTNGNTTISHNGVNTSGGVIRNASGANIVMNDAGALDLERDVNSDFWRVIGVGY